MDIFSSEKISFPEASPSPTKIFTIAPQIIDPAPDEPIQIPAFARSLVQTQPNPETSNPKPYVEASGYVAEDIVRLFS